MLLLTAVALLMPAALLARVGRSRWLSPGPMFAGYWLLAVCLPIAFMGESQISVTAVIYVTVAVLVFGLAFGIGSWRGIESQPSTVRSADPAALRWLVIAGTGSALVAALLALRSHGFNLGSVLSLQGLLDVGNALSVSRYASTGGGGMVTSILLALSYAASLAAPFTLLTPPPHRRLTVAAPLLGVLVYSTFTTERLGLLLSAAMTAGGYLGMRLMRDGELPGLSTRRVFRAVLATAIIAGLFVGIAFVRVGSYGPEARSALQTKMSIYAFGYMPAFSGWLETYRYRGASEPLGYGTGTVAGIGLLTGKSREDTRAYDDRVLIGPQGATTNIYTMFRNLLLDFSEAGALLMLFLAGLLTGRFYQSASRGSPIGAVLLGCSYSVILLSNTLPITTFTNVCAAMLLAVAVVSHAFREKLHAGIATLRMERYRRQGLRTSRYTRQLPSPKRN